MLIGKLSIAMATVLNQSPWNLKKKKKAKNYITNIFCVIITYIFYIIITDLDRHTKFGHSCQILSYVCCNYL